jgi:hypothetical protein
MTGHAEETHVHGWLRLAKLVQPCCIESYVSVLFCVSEGHDLQNTECVAIQYGSYLNYDT